MSASHLCQDCIPEGRDLGLGMTSGPPRHCHRRNDRVMPGVLGGYQCSCECCREDRDLSAVSPPSIVNTNKEKTT